MTVGQAYSGSFGLDLMSVTGIKDSSNNLLDNSLQTGPDEIHNDGGGIVCSGGDFHVCAIERNNPATEQISTGSVEYLVTFNNPAKNVDASDFVALRNIVTATPKVQNTAFDVWHTDEQASPSTSSIYVSSINTITSAKLILDASSPSNQYVSEWKLNLTAPDGTNMIITDNTATRLESAGGSHEFYLGEVIGLDPANGNWVLSAIDDSYDDDPLASGTDDPEGQINNWSLEFEHGTTYRAGTVGTVTQSGTDADTYLVPVTGMNYNYNGYVLWLKGDNDIELRYRADVIDPRTEFAPDPHESYNRGSVSIPSTPHVRGITVSSSTSSSVTFQVTFSETVTGVNATDFIVIQNGSPESSGPQESTYSSAPNVSINSGVITTVSGTIPISGYADGVVDVLTLDVDISHTRTDDLEVELVGPDGTTRMVHNNAGGATADLVTSFTPDFAGKPVNGNWTLQVRDNGSTQSYGIINSWSLDFSYEDTPTYDELLEVEADKGAAYTWKDFLPGNYNLRIYPDAPVHRTTCVTDGIMIDGYNGETACITNKNDGLLIYTTNAYMRYPVTVEVTLFNVRMTDSDKPDVGLRYLDGSYESGSVFFIPLIPGMSTLEMNIAGTDAVVYLADVTDPVQIVGIPSAHGSIAASGASMFATTNGELTAYIDVSTSSGGNYVKTFDYTDRYHHLKTDPQDWWSSTYHMVLPHGRYSAYAQSQLINFLKDDWSSIVGSASTSGSSTITIYMDVLRNGVVVASDSASGTIATLEKICNGLWIPENIRFTINVDARFLQKV